MKKLISLITLVFTHNALSCPNLVGVYNCGTDSEGKQLSLEIKQDLQSYSIAGFLNLNGVADGTKKEAVIEGTYFSSLAACNPWTSLSVESVIEKSSEGMRWDVSFVFEKPTVDKLTVQSSSVYAKGSIKSDSKITYNCQKN